MHKEKILVVGGTGKVGRELVSLLLAAGQPVRVLSRSCAAEDLFKHSSVEITHGDLKDQDSLAVATQNISTVFLLTRDQPQQAELEGNLVDAASRSGVNRIVKSSAFAAGLQPPVGYGIAHAESERKLINSGLQWTILRPYMFMQNFLDMADLIKNREVLPLPLGTGRVSLIDARDVALVAQTVLMETGHENKIYELTGPKALSMSDCADVLSILLNKKIRYRSPPYWLAGLMMRLNGTSAWNVKMLKQLFGMIRAGGEEEVTNSVREITGQEPRTLEDFLTDHLSLFK